MSKPGVSLSDDSNEVICSRKIEDSLNHVLHSPQCVSGIVASPTD